MAAGRYARKLVWGLGLGLLLGGAVGNLIVGEFLGLAKVWQISLCCF
jgi:hypothetical protein